MELKKKKTKRRISAQSRNDFNLTLLTLAMVICTNAIVKKINSDNSMF